MLDVASSLGKPLGPQLTFEQKAQRAVNSMTAGAEFVAFTRGETCLQIFLALSLTPSPSVFWFSTCLFVCLKDTTGDFVKSRVFLFLDPAKEKYGTLFWCDLWLDLNSCDVASLFKPCFSCPHVLTVPAHESFAPVYVFSGAIQGAGTRALARAFRCI